MKKKNYLIPILSIAFIGTAAFFIFKSLSIKKEKQRHYDRNKDIDKDKDKNLDTTNDSPNQGILGEILKNIFVKKDNSVSEQPINDGDKQKLAAQVLTSKQGTNIREKPKSNSKVLITLRKGDKLNRIFSKKDSNNVILPNPPVKEGNYTWVNVFPETNTEVRGWVRLDVVDL